MTDVEIKQYLFQLTNENFDSLAIEVFRWQALHNPIYKEYINLIHCHVEEVTAITQIPFLPIQFFKTHQIMSDKHNHTELIFESSGTTGQIPSCHFVADKSVYEQSFQQGFKLFFGEVKQYCILGLLPSYLERGQSSLVYMVNQLIQESAHVHSGFYLHNHADLFDVIQELEQQAQPTLLFGVTYALLDFAEKFRLPLRYVKIVETGGMKGRRKELLRGEVHEQLKDAFQLDSISSEYGMTELLSQAYAMKNGIFQTPPWMKVLVRELNDPLTVHESGKGIVNIIDLANIYSCSFIATDDLGEVYPSKEFIITGRLDQSELRGCSLMVSGIV